jgi:diguanylate cyclase (GGDEF)-like protein
VTRTSSPDAGRSERLRRVLFAVSDLSGSSLDMPELLRGIQTNVGTLMHAENFFVVLFDEAGDSFRYLCFVDAEDPDPVDPGRDIAMSEREYSLTWHLLRGGRPLMGDIAQLRDQVVGPLAVPGPLGKHWMGVPMLRDGRVHGAVVVKSYRDEDRYSAEDRELLEFVANHIVTALERKQARDDLEQRVRARTLELQREIQERHRAERLQAALFQIAQLATADISQTEFYCRVHAVVAGLIYAKNFYIALLTGDGASLEFAYFVDEIEPHPPERRLGAGLCEVVLREGNTLLGRAQIEALAERGRIDPATSGAPAECWLGVPLRAEEATIGLIVVQSYDADVAYAPADLELLSFVASQVATSLLRRRAADTLRLAYAELEQRVQQRTRELSREIEERERIEYQLIHKVMHDALTGLPNRGFLRDRLERLLALMKRDPDRRCALLFLDLDRFKAVNDTLGHLAGDEVLREFARRLQTCVRTPDIVARLSGDEFAILLEDVPLPSTPAKVASRVLLAMGKPFSVGGTELVFSTSIGIAIGDERYRRPDEILRDADTAMYRAKTLGRGRYEMFDESLNQAASDDLLLEDELRAALQQDQFEPHFQPIIRLETGQVVGYEALIRWNHPTRGVLGPAHFLKIAEDIGSLQAIDWRVFELACSLAARSLPDGNYVAINVSPRQFRRPGFVARVIELLEATGLPPRRLLLELTEASLIEHPEQVRATLEQLSASGIGAALDDFGMGYSSLSYLRTLPLRALKVDRAFVAELDRGSVGNTASAVISVLACAHALGMNAVAKGIETDAQHEALIALECEYGQGFLLGRPAPIGHWNVDGANRG